MDALMAKHAKSEWSKFKEQLNCNPPLWRSSYS
jgi:hypothetical protein